MFNKLREAKESESGTIVSVYILAAAILFITTIGIGFTLGKYVQAGQQLNRCANMVAKGTMVAMQRQPPPNKGVLTADAIIEGNSIFNEGLCNVDLGNSPLIRATQTLNFEMVASDTLVVTIDQYAKGFFLNGAFPWKLTAVGAAYTYQYGGQSKNPIYNSTGFRQNSPLLGALQPLTQATYDDPYPNASEGTICHATGSIENPYGAIGPSSSAIINGHMGHSGEVFNPSMKSGDDWGDIIPPMPTAGVAGMNWTQEGKAIWHNDCEY
jgi:hypothetical protein